MKKVQPQTRLRDCSWIFATPKPSSHRHQGSSSPLAPVKNLIRNTLTSWLCFFFFFFGVSSRVTDKRAHTHENTHTHIISIRQLHQASWDKYIYIHPFCKYLLHISFPFIQQAQNLTVLPLPLSLSESPSPPPPPLHLRFIDFTIYHMSRWERSSLHLNHGTNMRVIYCFKNPGPI